MKPLARCKHLFWTALIVLCLGVGFFGCVGSGGGVDSSSGPILSNPQPALPGLTQGYVLTNDLLSSNLTALQAADAPHDFSFILLPPDQFLTTECLIGLGEDVYTTQVVWPGVSPNFFGPVHLINPDVDPYKLSIFCGITKFDLSLINGDFSHTITDPVPLSIGENYLTVPRDIQFEIHNGAGYFLLITSPGTSDYSYKLESPEYHAGPEYSFYVPGLRDLLQNGVDVKIRFFRRTSVNILDFIPTTIEIVDPSQDPEPIYIPDESSVFAFNDGEGYHNFSIVLANGGEFDLWDCRFSTSGVHSGHFIDNDSTYLVPSFYNPFDMRFFCSSTLTYQPNLVAENLLTAPIDPVMMEVRGDFVTIPDDDFQQYLKETSGNVYLVVTKNTSDAYFPIEPIYAWPDWFHYPELEDEAPYAFSTAENLSAAILGGEDIMLHFYRFKENGGVERIPVSLSVLTCEQHLDGETWVETCQD